MAPPRQRAKQDKEIKNYTLVGNKGWLTACKVLVCLLLAAWNAHFFITTIPGFMGILTAIVAISVEITALYCVHNYTRSVDEHKVWLGRFAVILGGFSLIHAVLAIIDYTGYLGQNAFISLYSHVLALPIIVILLSVTTATLSMKHWSADVTQDLAFSKLQSLRNRAQVLMEQHRLLDAHELSQLKASLFDQGTALKMELVPIVQRRIKASEELEHMIAEIDDPRLQQEIRKDFNSLTSSHGVGKPLTAEHARPAKSPHSRPSMMGLDWMQENGGYNGHP